MAADAVFSGLVSGLFAVNIEQAVTHLFWIGLWSWITAGFSTATAVLHHCDGWPREHRDAPRC